MTPRTLPVAGGDALAVFLSPPAVAPPAPRSRAARPPAGRPDAPALLMGVDIVECDRLARAMARGGEVFARHVSTPDELTLGPGVAAFSVKESLIKAVGVRPAGFSWHDFEALPDRPPAWAAALLDEAAAELADATGVSLTGGAAYAVRGASARAAAVRLGPGVPVGAARWGESQGLFAALAVVYARTVHTQEEGMPS
ncbi:4'-phosphopantetheinyl transferase superfamily protein [Streptosporangium sp. NPDC004379]|uniref:4'-phosphopantetheinyl transferase superfamily protein n=1 Tax=Streptosporangium sp. NPDC004379 TaxID=3366189 RepID=UPI0036891579